MVRQELSEAQIPDLHPVYDGVRGRTMSSRHQGHAWPALVEAGVKTVIDLRDGDASDRLPNLCRQHGLAYFHYPVDNHGKSIGRMAALLPRFCELIDQGDFYIACAMGLHRTDIALCTYWMFHGADKGLAPPAIVGYSQATGHNTDKIMQVLNKLYAHLTDRDGTALMPKDVFKARKNVINEQSKKFIRPCDGSTVPQVQIDGQVVAVAGG